MDKRKLIFTSLIVLALVVATLSITYALNVNVTQNDTTDYDLSYTFDISDNATWTINLASGKTKIYEISITNPYSDSIKYGIVYKMDNPTTMPDNSLVGIVSTSENYSQGSINSNSTINVSIAVVNSSTSNMQVTLSVISGYKNGGELIIPDGYTLITEEYEVVNIPAKRTLKQLGLTANETVLTTFTNTSKNDGTTGIYKAEDDLGESYYFRGNVTNNYVKFAGYYWRIIRINGDGSIRMIYDGTSAHANNEASTDRQIGKSAYNTNYNDNAYVGYMYGTAGSSTYEATHANTNDSTIKTYLDNWYNSNIKGTTDEQYVADAIYCNDRTRVTDSTQMSALNSSFGSTATGEGYGTKVTYYGFLNRTLGDFTTAMPSLKCEQLDDKFTKSSSLGNGKLDNPIGLITLDEMVYAGSYLYMDETSVNDETYLYNGSNWYWSMSPFGFYDGGANVGDGGKGALGGNSVDHSGAVRAVISLSSGALKYGNGTSINPYRVNSSM